MRHLRSCVPILLLAVAPAMVASAEPDEAVVGRELGYPAGTAATWYVNPYRVGSWSVKAVQRP